ncbi:MAG: hypothetical protein CMP34_04355 [Rickettsiales bacterium]|nr:hypothetical protein [Rickettsiales bacterium]|tara:strand:+ start:95 stop:769 length:675 start_codon:yes stop_codon:yes gene_type:complete
MVYSFDKNVSDLPKSLPIFPLSNVLLLPRSKLPLNLFENRYLHMFDYALANGRAIGMVQPKILKTSKDSEKNPPIYDIGCAGFITAFTETNDNRYEIILKGICRFFVKNELSLLNGFRRANVEWESYKNDLSQVNFQNSNNRLSFEDILKKYLQKKSINADWEAIEASSDEELINSISMGCPFDINEKQALLEAKSLEDRMDVLMSLMQMSMIENKSISTASLS